MMARKMKYQLAYDPSLNLTSVEGREARVRLMRFGEWCDDGWTWKPSPHLSDPIGKIRREGFIVLKELRG